MAMILSSKMKFKCKICGSRANLRIQCRPYVFRSHVFLCEACEADPWLIDTDNLICKKYRRLVLLTIVCLFNCVNVVGGFWHYVNGQFPIWRCVVGVFSAILAFICVIHLSFKICSLLNGKFLRILSR